MKYLAGIVLVAGALYATYITVANDKSASATSAFKTLQTAFNTQISNIKLDIDSAPHISIASGLKVCQFEAKYETHSNDYYDYQIASFDALNGNGCTETELYDSLSALEPTGSRIAWDAGDLAIEDMAIKGLITTNATCAESIPAGSNYFQIPRILLDNVEASVYNDVDVEFHAASDGTTHQNLADYAADNNGKDVSFFIDIYNYVSNGIKKEDIRYIIQLNDSQITNIRVFNDQTDTSYIPYPGNLCIYW